MTPDDLYCSSFGIEISENDSLPRNDQISNAHLYRVRGDATKTIGMFRWRNTPLQAVTMYSLYEYWSSTNGTHRGEALSNDFNPEMS
ncbi:MAG: hypothetical protein HRF40_06010 [Nitrososphaera sp.]